MGDTEGEVDAGVEGREGGGGGVGAHKDAVEDDHEELEGEDGYSYHNCYYLYILIYYFHI